MRPNMSLQLLEGAAHSLRVALGALSLFMDIPAGIIVTLYSLLSMAWSENPSQVWDNIGESWGVAFRSYFAMPDGLKYDSEEGYFHYLCRGAFVKSGKGLMEALNDYPVEGSMFTFLRTAWYFVVGLCVILSWAHIGSFIASAFYGVAGAALGIALCSLLTYVIACCIRAESPDYVEPKAVLSSNLVEQDKGYHDLTAHQKLQELAYKYIVDYYCEGSPLKLHKPSIFQLFSYYIESDNFKDAEYFSSEDGSIKDIEVFCSNVIAYFRDNFDISLGYSVRYVMDFLSCHQNSFQQEINLDGDDEDDSSEESSSSFYYN